MLVVPMLVQALRPFKSLSLLLAILQVFIHVYSLSQKYMTAVTAKILLLLACQSSVSPEDYEAVDVTLTFQPCNRQQCVNVSITDDLINEPEERFAVSLTLSDDASSLINLVSATGDIVITDDDGK